jgi:hypothetical protein
MASPRKIEIYTENKWLLRVEYFLARRKCRIKARTEAVDDQIGD